MAPVLSVDSSFQLPPSHEGELVQPGQTAWMMISTPALA